MCNEKAKPNPDYDYKFLDYRLTQLEQNLRKGQEKLETVQTQNYNELLKILRGLQENNQTQNQTLTELNTRIQNLEEKNKCIDKIKEATTSHAKQIENLEKRLDTYKQITIAIGMALIGTMITLFFNILTKVL